MKYRRFGKTELNIPVISCGGMRYQHSWNGADAIPAESQANVEACVWHALELGINHIETARGYGTSEAQLGKILPQLPRNEIIVQTKVGPCKEVADFVGHFETSTHLLGLDYIDLFAFHGINTPTCLENTMRCMDQALAWKREGRIRHIGFSTHGPCDVISDAINTGAFEYVNLHWYYIFQENWPAVEAAHRHDMGVFIISPNDKGGLLYRPSEKLVELCAPLHPMVFNGLFCLRRPEVHTLSCGVARPSDFDAHMAIPESLERVNELLPPIEARLSAEMERVLGADWTAHWREGLPEWEDTPGEINIPWILRLRNLAVAFDLIEFGKMRYNLLGNGGVWFPGKQATDAQSFDFAACLSRSPYAATIPQLLAQTHELLAGDARKRLQQEEA